MLAIIFIVVLGIAFAYFATINTALININLGFYNLSQIPVYLAILVSVTIGLLLTALFYAIKSLSSSLTINEKESEIKNTKKEVAELTKKLHQLEIENTKLKSKNGVKDDFDEEAF